MKILMISHWDFQDFGMQAVKKTPLHFAQAGHQITFLVHSEMTAKPTIINDLHENIDVRRFDIPLKALSEVPKVKRARHLFFFTLFCLRHCWKHMRGDNRPDLIYAAECDAILISRILRLFYSVPFVTRYYGISTDLLKRPMRHLLYSFAVRAPADLAVVTDDGTDGKRILEDVNDRVKRIEFLKNGIKSPDTDDEKVAHFRQELGIQPDEFVMITVSRLYAWKRVDRAIRMLAHLTRDSERKVKLIVVGHGPERPILEDLANELGVSDYVVFAGAVSHEDIYNVYASAHALLSLYDMSNVGNPLWEAMNAGLAIVTLNTGTTGDVITDRENGLLLEVGEDEDELFNRLAIAVARLIDHPEEQKKLAAGAKAYGEKHLQSWDDRLETELHVLEALVNAHQAN